MKRSLTQRPGAIKPRIGDHYVPVTLYLPSAIATSAELGAALWGDETMEEYVNDVVAAKCGFRSITMDPIFNVRS